MLECDGESVKFCVSDRPGPFRFLGEVSPAELQSWVASPGHPNFTGQIKTLRLSCSNSGRLIIEWDESKTSRSASFSLRDIRRCCAT